MSYIKAIETAVPTFCHDQSTVADFYSRSTSDETLKRKIRIIAKKSGIRSRYSVIEDFSLQPDHFTFFASNSALLPEPTLTARMQVFKKNALKMAVEAVGKIKNFEALKPTITHLITVTCTGLFAPGLDIELIRELGLSPRTNRSSVNFMGCNAAILALKQADALCKANTNANVLVVCVELCTIHFQKQYTDDYLLSNTLFGDGAAAVLVGSTPTDDPLYERLAIKSFDSLILHSGHDQMAWQLSETGFMMSLSSYVSALIKENIGIMLADLSVNSATVTHWAVHPGGKKILDDFAHALHLTPQRLAASYDVLAKYGNMSSPTVLFVLKAVVENNAHAAAGDTILAAAFGPGLSIETAQLQYV